MLNDALIVPALFIEILVIGNGLFPSLFLWEGEVPAEPAFRFGRSLTLPGMGNFKPESV